MKAETVRKEMNRCGKAGIPFLCGIDFEMENGFFVEDPLHAKTIYFRIGPVGNAPSEIPPATAPRLTVHPNDFEAYRNKFGQVRQGLMRGDSFLLNLTEKTAIESNLSLEQIFLLSQAHYKLLYPEHFVCFSPETFVRIRHNEISSFPMKGTIDATLPEAERQLLSNYKEECEHHTIVDLIRNDLNMVATRVRVKRFRYVEKIPTLHGEILQTSSEISGLLPDGWAADLGNLLFKLLPAGSISGAPKPATVHLIRQAEKIPRGYYTGIFGYYDGQEFDSAVMIRYIEKESDRYYFRSGGGITVHSSVEDEYREILEKIYLPIHN